MRAPPSTRRETRLSRRKLGALAAASGAGLALDAFAIEPNWLDVSEWEVALHGLPHALDGFVIAHVTDAHLTAIGRVEEAIAREVKRRGANLVVLTGDMVDAAERLPILADLCDTLAGAGRSVLATLGNWEHWGRLPRDTLQRTCAKSGARLLVEASEPVNSALNVVATDDFTAGKPSLARLLRSRTSAAVQVLLTHSPALLDEAPPKSPRFDLTLAGHTHGGQVALGSFAPVRPPGSGRYSAGWYETPLGNAYVSRGTGTSLVPARFSCRPELPIFTLRRT